MGYWQKEAVDSGIQNAACSVTSEVEKNVETKAQNVGVDCFALFFRILDVLS